MNNKKISIEQKEGIYYLGFGEHETKSLTVISEETLLEMDEALSEIKGDKNAKGLVLFSHKPGCFLAGMDVSVIQSLTSEIEASQGCEKGQEVFNKLEDLKIPTMALVDGVCLGGGLEMALSCDKIICSDNKKTALGLPEVMLGVLPGFGGTYRLPRKIGLTTSLDLLLTGKQVKAKKAKRMGLVEAVMPAERLLEKAAEYLFKKESHNNKVNVSDYCEDDDGDGVNTILEDEDQDMNPRNDLNVGPDGVTIIPHYLNTLETTDHGNPGLTDTNIYTRTVTINFLIIDFNLEILSSDAIDFGTLTYSFNLPDDED